MSIFHAQNRIKCAIISWIVDSIINASFRDAPLFIFAWNTRISLKVLISGWHDTLKSLPNGFVANICLKSRYSYIPCDWVIFNSVSNLSFHSFIMLPECQSCYVTSIIFASNVFCFFFLWNVYRDRIYWFRHARCFPFFFRLYEICCSKLVNERDFFGE